MTINFEMIKNNRYYASCLLKKSIKTKTNRYTVLKRKRKEKQRWICYITKKKCIFLV